MLELWGNNSIFNKMRNEFSIHFSLQILFVSSFNFSEAEFGFKDYMSSADGQYEV